MTIDLNLLFDGVTAFATFASLLFMVISSRLKSAKSKEPTFICSLMPLRNPPDEKWYGYCAIAIIPGEKEFRIRKISVKGALISRAIGFTDRELPGPVPVFPTSAEDWCTSVPMDVVIPTRSEATYYEISNEGIGEAKIAKRQLTFHLFPTSSEFVFNIKIIPSIWEILLLRSFIVRRTVAMRMNMATANKALQTE